MCGTETVGVLGGVVVELVDVRGVAAGGVMVGYLQGAVSVPALTIDIGSPFFGQVNNASASERDE
ncbi:hypothetical protein ABT030_28960 [Streptomyces mirabilis]|uniref:hypothetical protein n=1 Tax=Streptomyces mirabilis TaxID=68239 RepID=UPI0033246C73